MPEERVKFSPVVVLGLGLGAAVVATVLIYTIAQAAPPPEGYPCPYCPATFDTYEDLVAHIQSEHPGERIPIHIIWQ